MNNLRSSLVWKKYEPKKRGSIMEKYKGRFVVHLSESKKVLYLSDMIIAKFVNPKYISLASNGSLVGLAISDKEHGFKVDYKPHTTSNITIPAFIKQLEEERKKPIEPGVYECYVERIDAGTVDAFDLVIFNTADAPTKVHVNNNGKHKEEEATEEATH